MKTIEERIVKDKNNFYRVQVRFLPLEDWEADEGWRTTYITDIYEDALSKLRRKAR